MKINDQKITRELLEGNTLAFRPKTKEEAEFIQHKIFELGLGWLVDGKRVHGEIRSLAECVSKGLLLADGALRIYNAEHARFSDSYEYGASCGDAAYYEGKPILYCTSAQLDDYVRRAELTRLGAYASTVLSDTAKALQRAVDDMEGVRSLAKEDAEWKAKVEAARAAQAKREADEVKREAEELRVKREAEALWAKEEAERWAQIEAARVAEAKKEADLQRNREEARKSLKINDQHITKEFCKGKTLIFFPKTEEEAALIQSKLYEMGFKQDDGTTGHLDLKRCVSGGISLDETYGVGCNPGFVIMTGATLCTAAEFDKDYVSTLQTEKVLAESEAMSRYIDKELQDTDDELARVRAANKGLTGTFNKPQGDTPTTTNQPPTPAKKPLLPQR